MGIYASVTQGSSSLVLFSVLIGYGTDLAEPRRNNTVSIFKDYPCNTTIWTHAYDSGILSTPNYPVAYPHSYYCVVIIAVVDKGYRVRVTFNTTFHIEEDDRCSKDYVHIGNSLYTINMNTLTSYKFCGSEAPGEIVSRRGRVWIVFRTDEQHAHAGFSLKYDILPVVPCFNESYFPCSPLECIRNDQLCDGRTDCANGRDEYCVTPGSTTCFLCDDGVCIRPTLPVYHVSYDRPWWWLCDKFPHCADGTDERMDVCLTLSSVPAALYDCQSPELTIEGVNRSAVLWRRLTCDSKPHCQNGEDEAEDLCVKLAVFSGFEKEKFVIPLSAALLFCFTITLLYNRGKCRRESGQSPVNESESRMESLRSRRAPRTEPCPPSQSEQQGPSCHPNYYILSQTTV